MKLMHRVTAFMAVVGVAACSAHAPNAAIPPTHLAAAAVQPAALNITEIPIPTSIGGAQGGLGVAADGTVYFSTGNYYVGGYYRDGAFTGIPLDNQMQESYAVGPVGISRSGDAFFSVDGAAPSSSTTEAAVQSYAGRTSNFTTYAANALVDDLAGDSFGNVWMTVDNGSTAGSRFAKIVGGNLNTVRTADALPKPLRFGGIASVSDGTAWVAVSNGTLRHYSSTLSLLAVVTLPRGMHAGGLVIARDGSLWWTDPSANKIGHLRDRKAVEFRIPSANSGVGSITRAADGALWFTESRASKIGRVDARGSITEYPTPTPNAIPSGITGPYGSSAPDVLWFVEAGPSKLGRIAIP